MQEQLRYIKGVGPKKEQILNSIGIYNCRDLLYYFPFRYEDRSNFKKIKDLEEGVAAVVCGKVLARRLKKMPFFLRKKSRVRSVYEVVISDDTAKAKCVWFNQHFLADSIKVDDKILVYGKPIAVGRDFKFNSPEKEVIKESDSLEIGRIVPVYRKTAELNDRFLRRIVHHVLERVYKDAVDSLPFYIRKENNLLNITVSLENIHFPKSLEQAKSARERFIFEELFYSQVFVYLRKARHRKQKGVQLKISDKFVSETKKNLGFELTASQTAVIKQISDDLSKTYPMHRLIQGDVGCGKTVVAAFAIGMCVYNGYQAAFMVPTEVLAVQHKDSLDKIFARFGFKIVLLTSSLSKKECQLIYDGLEKGDIDIVIGTHALIQTDVKFLKLGLVVIDEQHKFGVAQRALLPKKSELSPHCLIMSATPIPRTLALSIYGDLDLSVINELPKNRKPTETILVKEAKRLWVYELISQRLAENRQIYFVYPVIEETEEEDMHSLEVMSEEIKKQFKPALCGVFHGKMKVKDKIAVIEEFRNNKIQILIATTVVEVGVSIPNATTMVVESPHRFGLAQLHQLRGRIRRSDYDSYFIMLSKDNLSPVAKSRLKTIASTSDGFKIAEEDLLLRGPGDFFGTSQHGCPQLKIANPLRDLEILKQARAFAYQVIKNDPELIKKENLCIKNHFSFWLER